MNAMANFSNGFKQTNELCEIHTGVLKIHAGPYKICPKCALEKNAQTDQSRKADQAEIDRAVREKHFGSAMLPDRHSDSAFSNYRVDHNGQANAINQCMQYAQALIDGKNPNLIMVGYTGTGKTHLACATARTLQSNGFSARYITSEELAQRIMTAWDKDTKGQSEQSVIHAFTEYDLLILDEYGLHDRDKRLELVHKVLTARYDRKKPTMLISNFTMKKLKSDLGDRLWSRFQHDGLTMVECNWSDARVGVHE
ncbi:ATP-binding protein [Acinetobacter ursingii]|uniref:ATP-binding protein n=1 Tax=Acinetobacter ursingii TaxID=108980 RepID=UPI003AF9FBDC